MLKQIALLTLFVFNFSAASATVEVIETCRIEASFQLETPTQIFCAEDLVVEEGVKIAANGHGLQIVSAGRLHFGATEGASEGVRISSNAPVLIYARTAIGHLTIENEDSTLGSHIEIEYGSTYNYQQSLNPGGSAEVRMVVAGEALQLVGDQHRLPLL